MSAFHLSTTARRPLKIRLRLVSARSHRPLTSKAEVAVRSLSRRGAQLLLESPFIDGLHVLMDVHNITPKLVEVFFPGENPETHGEVSLLGDIKSYRHEEEPAGVRFVLEVAWLEDQAFVDKRERDLKRLIRLIKKDLHSLGTH